MGAAAIVALLLQLLPLLPAFEQQIMSIVGEIKNKGELSPLAISQIHELAASIHQQVVDEENKRLPASAKKKT